MKKAGKLLAAGVLLLFAFSGTAQKRSQYKLPAARTAAELQLDAQRHAVPEPFTLDKSGSNMPANVRYPGEYEESQAVAIAWSHEYDLGGNIIGVDTTAPYGYISAQCAKYISDELPVWIRVPFAADTATVKDYMQRLGWPLTTNYRFFVTTAADDWWMRDFGPNGIYYGNKDSVGFVDLKYYAGRDSDNVFPAYLAKQLGYLNIISRVNGEGGNLMSDGFGKVFTSDMTTYVNGLTQIHNPAWSNARTIDSVKNIFNATTLYNMTRLNCEGGTGHIDLYLKLVDEQTLLVAQYPSVITAGDRQIIEDNYQLLAAANSTYNRPYRIFRVPLPTDDFGLYTRTNCQDLDFDARTFVNGITANKTFIYPSYSDGISGNQPQTDSVTQLFRKILKGYKVVPIDSRMITTNGGGGAIHCITMQIPAENPVLFWHPSVDGLQPLKSNFHILAKITNHSGILSAICKWQVKGATSWQNLALTDSSGYFIGDISAPGITDDDFIVYYLEATTNNGKTAVKPITAPDGFYTIYFKQGTDIFAGFAETLKVESKDHLFGAYPNPTSGTCTIPFHLNNASNVSIQMTDVTGRLVFEVKKGMTAAGIHDETVDVSTFRNGLYFYSLVLNGQKTGTRKLRVQH